MATRDHLRDAVRAGDRLAQCIYGDWLEEQGDEEQARLCHSNRWALVPSGTFWMGGGGGKPGEKKVTIPYDFYLGVYLVTQGEWEVVMGSNPSYFARQGVGKDMVQSVSDADLDMFPVEHVSWDDTQEFLQKLNAQEPSSQWVYRLPTEAEWEYACRGAPATREECSYYFYLDKPSNSLSSTQANFDGNHPAGTAANGPYLQRTTKVGSYQPNRLGIFDMHGNVWEWTDKLEGSSRVIRGGSWYYYGSHCQAAYRYGFEPSDRFIFLGARLARVPSGE